MRWTSEIILHFVIILLCNISFSAASDSLIKCDNRNSSGYHTVFGVINSTATLQCFNEEIFSPFQSKSVTKILWKRVSDDSYLVMNSHVFMGDKRIRTSATTLRSPGGDEVTIDYLQPQDEGAYECIFVMSNKPHKRCIRLVIQFPPHISASPSSPRVSTVNEGESVQLQCHAEGKPQPNITWARPTPTPRGQMQQSAGNNPAPPYSYSSSATQMTEQLEVIQHGPQLNLSYISRHQAGLYVCIADNGVGSAAMHNFTVNVHYRPQITVTNDRIGQERHKRTMIRGQVKGYPVKEIAWYFNHKKLQVTPTSCMSLDSEEGKYCFSLETLAGTNHTWRATLWILDLVKEDFGMYSLSVSSPFGEDAKHVEVFEVKPVSQVNELSKQREEEEKRRQLLMIQLQRERELSQSSPSQYQRTPQSAPLSERNSDSHESLSQVATSRNNADSSATSLRFRRSSFCSIFIVFSFVALVLCG